MFARRRVVVGQHHQAARQRLGHHVAEGLRHARKHKRIRRRIVRRQRLAALHPRIMKLRITLSQRLALRPVAHQHKLRARFHLLYRQKRRHRQRKILLRRDTSHVNHHRILRPHAPRRPQLFAALRRRKQFSVHSACQHGEPLKAIRRELLLQIGRRHHRAPRAVVKPPHIPQREIAPKPQSVVSAILVEVCMKTRRDRQPQQVRRAQSSESERSLGRDMHHIRPPLAPARLQPSRHRQPHAQRGVKRDRHARHEQVRHGRPDAGGLLFDLNFLARSHHLDIVPACTHARHQPAQRHGDAVDLRRKCFGDEGDVHAS